MKQNKIQWWIILTQDSVQDTEYCLTKYVHLFLREICYKGLPILNSVDQANYFFRLQNAPRFLRRPAESRQKLWRTTLAVVLLADKSSTQNTWFISFKMNTIKSPELNKWRHTFHDTKKKLSRFESAIKRQTGQRTMQNSAECVVKTTVGHPHFNCEQQHPYTLGGISFLHERLPKPPHESLRRTREAK
jgi:hypothetical protein